MIVGFLGGGNMAAALIKGLCVADENYAKRIIVSDVKSERLATLKTEYAKQVLDLLPATLERACSFCILNLFNTTAGGHFKSIHHHVLKQHFVPMWGNHNVVVQETQPVVTRNCDALVLTMRVGIVAIVLNDSGTD